MKLLSSAVLLAALTTLGLLAAPTAERVDASAGRQVSQPMAKAIKRRPVEQSREQPQQGTVNVASAANSTGAAGRKPFPTFDDDEFVKRLSTEAREFDREWAERRGIKTQPKQPQQQPPYQGQKAAGYAQPPPVQSQPQGQSKQQQGSQRDKSQFNVPPPPQQPKRPAFDADKLKELAASANIDDLLEKTGFKDIVAPIAEKIKSGSGGDVMDSIRQMSETFLRDPEKRKQVVESPEVQQLMDRLGESFPGKKPAPGADGQKRQPTLADILGDFGAAGKAGKRDMAGLEDLYEMLGTQKDQAGKKPNLGGLDDLFGDLFKAPGDSKKKSPYDAYSSKYGGTHRRRSALPSLSGTSETDWEL